MKVDDEAMIAIINISSLTGGGVACLRVPDDVTAVTADTA